MELYNQAIKKQQPRIKALSGYPIVKPLIGFPIANRQATPIILDTDETTQSITLFNEFDWVLFHTELSIDRCPLACERLMGLFLII